MSTQNSSSFSNTTVTKNCSQDSTAMLMWTVISITCFLLGLPVCLMVLKELLHRKRQRVSNDFFMSNLAITDTVLVGCIPFSLLNDYIWKITNFECFNIVMDGLTLCNRPLLMACICADCYFAVLHPIKYMTTCKTMIIRRLSAVTIWISTLCFTVLKCSLNKPLFLPAFNALPLFIALPAITFCNMSVLQTLRKPDPTGNNNIHPQKKQALYTIKNSFIMTFVSYLPPVISFSFAGLAPTALFCVVDSFGFIFALTGCIIMPILYLDSVGKLNTFKELWRKYI